MRAFLDDEFVGGELVHLDEVLDGCCERSPQVRLRRSEARRESGRTCEVVRLDADEVEPVHLRLEHGHLLALLSLLDIEVVQRLLLAERRRRAGERDVELGAGEDEGGCGEDGRGVQETERGGEPARMGWRESTMDAAGRANERGEDARVVEDHPRHLGHLVACLNLVAGPRPLGDRDGDPVRVPDGEVEAQDAQEGLLVR